VDLDNPLFHTGDPSSSSDAAHAHVTSGAQAKHAIMVLSMVAARPGCTAVELWTKATAKQQKELRELQEVRRRLTDLHHAGYVRQGVIRSCTVRKDRRMVPWFVITQPTIAGKIGGNNGPGHKQQIAQLLLAIAHVGKSLPTGCGQKKALLYIVQQLQEGNVIDEMHVTALLVQQ